MSQAISDVFPAMEYSPIKVASIYWGCVMVQWHWSPPNPSQKAIVWPWYPVGDSQAEARWSGRLRLWSVNAQNGFTWNRRNAEMLFQLSWDICEKPLVRKRKISSDVWNSQQVNYCSVMHIVCRKRWKYPQGPFPTPVMLGNVKLEKPSMFDIQGRISSQLDIGDNLISNFE